MRNIQVANTQHGKNDIRPRPLSPRRGGLISFKRKTSGGGFGARHGESIFRWLMYFSFVGVVVLPSLATATYFGLIASDQFEVEARFSVAGNDIPRFDGNGTVMPDADSSIVQDTQLVLNYLNSTTLLREIMNKFDIRGAYSRNSIDFISRFNRERPFDQFVRYWQGMYTASISLPSGFIDLKIRAFSASDALAIEKSVISASENLLNEMNARLNADALKSAELELAHADERLRRARDAFEELQNGQGYLDALKAGDNLEKLIAEKQGQLQMYQQELMTQSKLLNRAAPKLKVLRDSIDALQKQITELEAQLASSHDHLDAGLTIASSVAKFDEVELERKIAENSYAGAVADLEKAKVNVSQKQMYLNEFVKPQLPEEPRYPRRLLYSSVALGLLLAAWGSFWGFAQLIRDHMA